jgi:hypothetical protein
LATRKRYPNKTARLASYSTGGSVAGAEGPPPSPPPPPPEHPDPAADHAITRAIEAQRRAEALHHDPQRAVSEYVDSLPGLSDYKKSFLRRYPLLLQPENTQILRAEYHAALQEGVPDDSDQMEHRLLTGIMARMRHNQAAENGARAAVMQAPPELEPSIERMAERLDHQAHQIHQVARVADSTPLGLALAPDDVMPPAPRARSLPISAPVSRDIPTVSGQRPVDLRSITLSPEERIIARGSYHWLPNDQAENLYARQKAKLAAMRAAGTYSE